VSTPPVDKESRPLSRVSPDVFQQGMTVTHPEYGPGKIVALSGAGQNRRATIQFATVGQKKIVLAHSALRPVQR
jgi:DNA helicase-2/ATP-dependent DNA helicase PcrA